MEGLSEWVVRTPAEVYGLLARGAEQRATGATRMNELSSRSHAVFVVIVECATTAEEPGDGGERRRSVRVGEWSTPSCAVGGG